MRFLLALMLLTPFVTLAAQDLDSPRLGAAAQAPTPTPSQALASLFDRIQSAENTYLIEQTGFAEWRWEALWLIAEGFDFRTSPDAYAAWLDFAALSTAEQTAFHEFVAESRQRMVAVGLN